LSLLLGLTKRLLHKLRSKANGVECKRLALNLLADKFRWSIVVAFNRFVLLAVLKLVRVVILTALTGLFFMSALVAF
jgi:hypothetical protein